MEIRAATGSRSVQHYVNMANMHHDMLDVAFCLSSYCFFASSRSMRLSVPPPSVSCLASIPELLLDESSVRCAKQAATLVRSGNSKIASLQELRPGHRPIFGLRSATSSLILYVE